MLHNRTLKSFSSEQEHSLTSLKLPNLAPKDKPAHGYVQLGRWESKEILASLRASGVTQVGTSPFT
jgi:hypothetical protein